MLRFNQPVKALASMGQVPPLGGGMARANPAILPVPGC
jgi:hypothetical protein